MAICQVKRGEGDRITKVLAANGQESIAYKSLLDVVNSIQSTAELQDRFRSWVGVHINNINDDRELALALYKQLYSPAFKAWFGDWTKGEGSKAVDKNGEPIIVYHGSASKDITSFKPSIPVGKFGSKTPSVFFAENESLARSYSSISSGVPGGKNIVYPAFLNMRNPYMSDKTDVSIPEGYDSSINGKEGDEYREYVVRQSNQIKSVFNQGTFDQNESNIYTQLKSSINPSKASPSTIKKVKEFLDRIGVEVQTLANIRTDGLKMGINGISYPLLGLIQVSRGKEDIALTEEAMHMAVEIVQQKDPALFNRMFSAIGNYNLTGQIFQQYAGLRDYQTSDGKPDVPKIKKEAIAKVLAQTVINKNEGVSERPELLAQTRTWWRAIIDFLKGLFTKARMDPFEEFATKVTQGEDIGTAKDIVTDSGKFLQVDDELVNKLNHVNENVAKTNEGYKINGDDIRNTVDDKVAEFYKRRLWDKPVSDIVKANREFKKETEGRANDDIRDILGRYIDDNNELRTEPLDQINPSSVGPYDNTFYNTLEESIKDMLAEYPSGTKFFKSINVYDDKTNTAGTIDLLATLPDGKIDILQFKVPELIGLQRDIPTYKQEGYNVEIEGFRKILQNGYGISRDQFRRTRAIPIRATYDFNIPGDPKSGLKVIGIKIAGANTKLITDDVLIAVPSYSETTGSDKLDKLIARLRGLVQRLSDEKVPPNKRAEKGQRIASLVASIRKLQIQHKADGVLSSGRTLVVRQREKFDKLKEVIANTDPAISTVDDLNKIAGEILDDKDEVEIYNDLYRVFKEVFSDGSEESAEYIKQARELSDDAQDVTDNYWDMSVDFRKRKIAAKLGIRDEFVPEKQLVFYRRVVRSLSQSSIKAGAMLWELVSNINNRLDIQFQDRLTALKKIEDDVDNWLKGKTINDLYKKIFQIRDGKWNGKVIQKYSRQFYSDLREAQEKNDLKWVKQNIDMDAYTAWYKQEHRDRVEIAKTARVHEDEEKNKQLIKQSLQDFVNTFSLSRSKGVNPNNYKLKEFPREDKWKSEEYTDLEKPENKPVFDLYKHWVDQLEESLKLGVIAEHNGWSWFPNARRSLLEKLTTAKAKGKLKSFFNNLRIESEDKDFGKIDPVTQQPIDVVHAAFVGDLMEWVKGADGKYFQDFSEKSMDIFNVMALWEREMVKYKLKTESENIAKMLAYTEAGRKGYKTKRSGKLDRDQNGFPIIVSNETNAKYIKEHIDAVYYNKHMSDESDIVIEIPYKSIVSRINKLFGRKLIDEPEEENVTVSGVKALSAVNRFFTTKTLGLNVFTSLAQLFGGSVNSYMNQGLHIDKMDILSSEAEYVSGRFWDGEERKKMAGLLNFFHAHLEDKTRAQIKNLSVSWAVKTLSSDHLFVGQRIADNMVNNVVTMSYIKNTLVVDGKLVNMREYARKELGHENKYSGDWRQTKEFEKRLEARIEELKRSPDALLNKAQIVDDKIVIPGIDRDSPEIVKFRAQIIQFVKDALGNTTHEDLSLYKRSVMWQSFFMFKNWIPRMLDVRLQSLKYVPGSQRYEWGRIRMLGTAVFNLAKSKNTSLMKTMLTANKGDLVTVAKKLYKEHQKYAAEQEQEFTMTEPEFIDMYIKGVRAEFKELAMALGMIAMLIAARAASPDKDEDSKIKGTYKWMLRGLDKLQDEVSFFYNPTSFTNIVNGSVFPAVGILVDIERFLTTGIQKGFYDMIGEPTKAGKYHPSKYLFKMMPITKELITYLAIFSEDFAREYDVKISSQNGSIR